MEKAVPRLQEGLPFFQVVGNLLHTNPLETNYFYKRRVKEPFRSPEKYWQHFFNVLLTRVLEQ
jgi:hypothetical protein